MKIALVQIDTTVGDFAGNGAAISRGLARAKAEGADLALFPELAVCGYPPLDLLERPGFVERAAAEEARIVADMPGGLVAVFGNVARRAAHALTGRPLENVAVVARRGEVLARVAKTLLPTYDVFDEARYFEPAAPDAAPAIFEIAGKKVGVTVCEDIWNDAVLVESEELWRDKSLGRKLYAADPVERLAAAGAEVLLNIAASPWAQGKLEVRERLMGRIAERHRIWLAYTNLVGGNDGLIFDGQSMLFSPGGVCVRRAAAFVEELTVVELGPQSAAERAAPPGEELVAIRDALVLGIRDYFRKSGIETAIIGLSGGIDSAVTAYLAVEALGPKNVIGVGMPSGYSSAGSIDDARALAENLGIRFELIAIQPVFEAFLRALTPAFDGLAPDVTEENLQSRIRGVMVMALANKHRAVVLSTGNKSEASMGYSTLYGDTVGALCVIADLYKHQVYALAELANRERPTIPEASITKAPSAELRPNQKDEDSLPPYPILDRLLEAFVEERAGAAEMATAAGADEALAREVIRKVYVNEFKRKQLPPTLRVSRKSWVGRLYPIVQRFTE